MSILNGSGKRREPTLGFPLGRIFAPDSFISVAGQNSNRDAGVLRNGNFVHQGSINSTNRLRKRKYDILTSSI